MKTKNLRTLAIAGTLLLWVTTATSDYIHEKVVDWVNTISICDPASSGIRCITMKDRNEWATKAGTWCSEIDSWVCGYHFQWWNNYWFEIWCREEKCSDSITNSAVVWRVNTVNFWPNNPYSNSVFYYGWENWSDPINYNLWWWIGDDVANGRWLNSNNAIEWRQWPCWEWYHIPSAWEWNKLFEYRISFYTWEWNSLIVDDSDIMLKSFAWCRDCPNTSSQWKTAVARFQNDFKIPFVGYRDNFNAKIERIGQYSYLFSSSYNEANYFTATWDERVLYFLLSSNEAWTVLTRPAYGHSVRCFKNEPLSFSLIEPIDSSIQVIVWETGYDGLPNMIEVTINNVEQVDNEPVLWEVSVSFWENVSAKFSKLVKVSVPVEDYEQVYIKVKHAWSSVYNYDWLTTNVNASCNDNWRVVNNADRYNWEMISVVNWFANIYTCEASSFIALWLDGWWHNAGWDSQIIVNIAEFNGGQNTCTWSNFIFDNIIAWTDTESYTLTWTFECAFWNGSSHSSVTLQLSGNLVASWDKIISWSNVEMMNSEWTVAPTWLKFANTLINTYRALTATQTIFQKSANLIWAATWEVTIRLTVPWWTPDGIYNWTLVLTY